MANLLKWGKDRLKNAENVAGGVGRTASKAYDTVNVLDGGRSWNTRQVSDANRNKSALQQAAPIAQSLVRAPAQTLNTLGAQGAELIPTIGNMFATHEYSNATKAYQDAVRTGNKDLIAQTKERVGHAADRVSDYNAQEDAAHTMFGDKGGLFNVGTIYNEKDSRSGDLKTGVTKIGGNILMDAATLVPMAKGGSVAAALGSKAALVKAVPALAAEGAGYGASFDVGSQLQRKGDFNIDTREVLKNAALGGVIGGALPIAGAGARAVAENAPKLVKDLPKLGEDGFVKVPGAPKGDDFIAPKPNTPEALQAQLPKGYKVDKTGSVFDAKGKELTVGQVQDLTQADFLTQFERATQSGDEATMRQIAAEHPGDHRVQFGETAPKAQHPVVDPKTKKIVMVDDNPAPALQSIVDDTLGPADKPLAPGVTGKKANLADTTTPATGKGKPQIEEPLPNQTASAAGGSGAGTGGTKPPAAGQEPLNQPNYPSSIEERSFIKTIVDDPNTSPQVKKALEDLDSTYMTRNTKALQTKAGNLIKDHRDIAEQLARNSHDDMSFAVGSELLKTMQKEKNWTGAVELANTMAQNATDAGRAVQALSIYGKLSPEGILRFSQSEINKYNKANGLTGKRAISLEPSAAEKLSKMAEDVQKMPEGQPRVEATAKLVAEIRNQMPRTLAEKLGTLQTMAQLLNIKTNVRNIAGNSMFGGLENISQTLATPVDKLLSMFTGERTTALPNLKTQTKGFVEGGKTGIREAKMGINTGPNTQFELNSVPVFQGKVLGTLEKTMNATLRGGDRAAYKAAFDDTLEGLMKLNKVEKPTAAMMEQAHQVGLYRTFQDTNAISGFFVNMKKALNKAGIGTDGARFGLGDLVLKYPKTPGNLLARGIDYSPAGFVKSVFEASKPLFGREFNQKAFVDSFSRAVVGSGSAFGIGYVLADNGIITAAPEQNKDLRNLQKESGQGGYQINASAFKRWVASGFNKDAAKLREGDTLVSYDWAQPIAVPISAGAALGEHKPNKAGTEPVNTVANSANTLVEQPLLQGVQRLFGGYGSLTDNGIQTLESLPASFVPTALNQVNQMGDNKSRNTSDANPAKEAYNLAISKVPGLAQTLPVQKSVLGEDKERYQNGGNNFFNVTTNPSFVSKYKPSTAAQEALGLYNKTGETKQTPNTVPKNITITGADGKPQKLTLTGKQQADYQEFVGKNTAQAINALVTDDRYKSLSDEEKVNLLSSIQTDINAAAKVKLFGADESKLDGGGASVLASSQGGGGDKAAFATADNRVQTQATKVAVEQFKQSNDKKRTIGDTFYYKDSSGAVKSKPKFQYDYDQIDSKTSLDMDRAKGADNLDTWMTSAQTKLNAMIALRDRYDPDTEADKVADITKKIEDLQDTAAKYNDYGGFTKGGSAGSKKKTAFQMPTSGGNSVLDSTATIAALLKRGTTIKARRVS